MKRKKRVPFNQNCDETLYEEFKSFVDSNLGSIAEHLESALHLYLNISRNGVKLNDFSDDEILAALRAKGKSQRLNRGHKTG